MPAVVYPENQRVVQFWPDIQQRVSSLPGVTAVAMLNGLPPMQPVNANDTQIEEWVDKPGGPRQNIDYWQTTEEHFSKRWASG